MVPENKIRTLLNQKRPTVATRIWSTWPTIIEAAAATGHFDYVEFVAEYAPFSQLDLENMVRAAELHGIGSMIKVDLQNRHYVAQRSVAMGFQSVLFTDHTTAEEVGESVRMMKPSVLGEGHFGFPNARWIGFNPHLKQLDYAEMVRNTVLAFMIEKKAAVENIEAICAIPGVDMVQFGPSDYAMSQGWNAGEHQAEIREAEEHVIEVALKHGVAPRCECDTLEKIEYYKALGVRHFCVGDEIRILNAYWKGTCGDVRKIADTL